MEFFRGAVFNLCGIDGVVMVNTDILHLPAYGYKGWYRHEQTDFHFLVIPSFLIFLIAQTSVDPVSSKVLSDIFSNHSKFIDLLTQNLINKSLKRPKSDTYCAEFLVSDVVFYFNQTFCDFLNEKNSRSSFVNIWH